MGIVERRAPVALPFLDVQRLHTQMTEKLTQLGVGGSDAMMDGPAPADVRFDRLGDLALLA